MAHSFSHRLIMTTLAGFCAAVLIFFYRHVVAEAIYENGAGWNDPTFQLQKKH